MTDILPADQDHRTRRSLPIALFLLVIVVVFPFIHPRGEQQASRYAATAAVWDQGTWEITEYAEILGRDGAVVDGAVYTDKAPGQPLLGVPFYGTYRLAGGDPLTTETADPDPGLWWVTLWTAGVPLAALALLMYRWAEEIEPGTALVATVSITFGTLLVVYGTLLFAHVLAALLGFAMFVVARKRDATNAMLIFAGVLGGAAVLVEYPVVLIVMVVMAAALYLHRWRTLWIVVGGLPMAFLLGSYNWVVFGSPFVLSYQWTAFSGLRDEAAETLEIFAGPSFDRFLHVLFSERGLLIATPVVAMALIGLVLLWRRGHRVDAGVAALAFITMLAIQGSWGNSYAGGAGPRYVIPGLPFLVAPLAVAWSRWRLLTKGLALFSVFTMFLATVTNPQLGSEFYAGMGFWLSELLAGHVAPTIYTELLGAWGWLVFVGTVVAAAVHLLRVVAETKRHHEPPRAPDEVVDETV